MPTNKVKSVKVEVKEKNFTFRFHPVYDDVENPEQLFCESCPLFSFCDLLSDPREPDNKETSFQDFCIATGDQALQEVLNDDKFENLLPEVSDVLVYTKHMDEDIYKKLIQKDPYVKVAEVIDCMCGPNGYTCPMYNPEHTNCSSTNGICILRKLFPGT